ncbi:FeoA family protein [Methanothermococcus okinawensis]|uniref:FeoA family protein n=1 Tax=Methanothermococcus okinawensis (strain DSM 14208 / JCM 11175 / IH1) TaxID=647113 RepID=F8AK89_METOI|nr:FeoA domain-containing protein [Methanothermococcus okinawensis]AEH07462.1 FeoA family protein [Methanothermococcus okinawensis IH1]
MYPIAFAREGEKVIVREIDGGHGVVGKLTDMGLNIGSEAIVVRNQNTGPLVVSIKGSNIALGRGLAMKILVNGE